MNVLNLWLLMVHLLNRYQYCQVSLKELAVLVPLMFLLYINDITNRVSSTLHLFADDCLLYRKIQSPQDSMLLQKDIISLGFNMADEI